MVTCKATGPKGIPPEVITNYIKKLVTKIKNMSFRSRVRGHEICAPEINRGL